MESHVFFWIGFSVASVLWTIGIFLFWSSLQQYHHEQFIDGNWYTTKKAHRVCGKWEETVSGGKFIGCLLSLWRTFPDIKDKTRFFLVRIDEYRVPKMWTVSRSDAEKFIYDCSRGDHEIAKKLITEWIDGKTLEEKPQRQS